MSKKKADFAVVVIHTIIFLVSTGTLFNENEHSPLGEADTAKQGDEPPPDIMAFIASVEPLFSSVPPGGSCSDSRIPRC